MTSTHFTTGTTITSEWLNDVNDAVYEGNITAEGVQYTPPFTGGVTETVEAKLAQYISVKDFGAVGDGVADDTDAIQNAIDACQPYDTLVFSGKFLISSTIEIDKPLRLKGERYGSSVWGTAANNGAYVRTSGTSIDAFKLVGGAYGGNVLSANYVLDVIFEDMSIQGYDGGSPYTGTGIKLDTSVPTLARNCKFIRTNIHFFDIGVDLTGCAYLTEFSDSTITTCNTGIVFAIGAGMTDVPSQNRFYNTTIDNIGGYCVDLTDAGYGDYRFYGCTITESKNGVYCRFDQDITFDGCLFESMGGSPAAAIRITPNNPTVTTNPNSKVFIGNKFVVPMNYSVYFDDTDGTQDNYQCPVVMTGNHFGANVYFDPNGEYTPYSRLSKSLSVFNNYFDPPAAYINGPLQPKLVTDLFYGISGALTQQYDPYRVGINATNPSTDTVVYRHMIENGQVVTISYIEFAALNPSTYVQETAQLKIFGGAFSNTLFSQTGYGVYVQAEESTGTPVTWKNTSGVNQYLIVQVNNQSTSKDVVGTIVFTVKQE